MNEIRDIKDDQIRIIGECDNKRPLPPKRPIILGIILLLLIIGIVILVTTLKENRSVNSETLTNSVNNIPEPALFEPIEEPQPVIKHTPLGQEVDSLTQGFTQIKDTLINDIPIRIFIPHNAELSLHIGRMNKEDKSIIYTAQAADVRADNGGIVGAFVLKGEPRAWGLSKKGFCASINGTITIGVAENSPLFEQATMEEGYFFRQYPLVNNGEIVDSELKGKAIRRGICDRHGEIFMVETGTAESFHDFSQALVDLGIDNAIYLVGSSAYGWAVDENGVVHEFGEDNYYKGRRRMPKNTSYIVWRRK